MHVVFPGRTGHRAPNLPLRCLYVMMRHYHIKDTQNHRKIYFKVKNTIADPQQIYEHLKPPQIYFAVQSIMIQSNSTLCSVLVIWWVYIGGSQSIYFNRDTSLQWSIKTPMMVSEDEETNQDWKTQIKIGRHKSRLAETNQNWKTIKYMAKNLWYKMFASRCSTC